MKRNAIYTQTYTNFSTITKNNNQTGGVKAPPGGLSMITFNNVDLMQCKCGCTTFEILKCYEPNIHTAALMCAKCGNTTPKFIKDMPASN